MGKNSPIMVFVEEVNKSRKEILFATWLIGLVADDGFFYGRKLSMSDLHKDGQMIRINAFYLNERKDPYLTINATKYTARYIESRHPKNDPRITILAESAVPKDILRGVTKEYLQFKALEGLWAERLRKAREQQAS